jgi:hypothetical protein
VSAGPKKGFRGNREKVCTISVRLSDRECTMLLEMAASEGEKTSRIVRDAIREKYLRHNPG